MRGPEQAPPTPLQDGELSLDPWAYRCRRKAEVPSTFLIQLRRALSGLILRSIAACLFPCFVARSKASDWGSDQRLACGMGARFVLMARNKRRHVAKRKRFPPDVGFVRSVIQRELRPSAPPLHCTSLLCENL